MKKFLSMVLVLGLLASYSLSQIRADDDSFEVVSMDDDDMSSGGSSNSEPAVSID